MLGNGVVPLQAAFALRVLLARAAAARVGVAAPDDVRIERAEDPARADRDRTALAPWFGGKPLLTRGGGA